jgi:hypothetical protein
MTSDPNENNDPVFEKFKAQLESHGMEIDSVDEKGLISISKDDVTLKVSLENVRRNYERDQDESHISALVDTLILYSIPLPEWQEAKDDIYISLFPNDHEFNDFINKLVTEEFSKVYIHKGAGKLSWISQDDLANWGINEEDLDKQASDNAMKLTKEATIQYELIEDKKLGFIESSDETLKAAILFSPNIKDKVMHEIGFPFYAVIPVRDFCYVFSEKDLDFFSPRLGSTVVQEYKESGYPITTEILKFTKEGVEAIGKYPVE